MFARRLGGAILALGLACGGGNAASAAGLQVTLDTGADDLRPGSWANFHIKLRGRPLITRPEFTGRGGLAPHRRAQFEVDIPELTDPRQVEYIQIQHVSQESFGQTADNWDLAQVRVRILSPVEVGAFGPHRFDGRARLTPPFPR